MSERKMVIDYKDEILEHLAAIKKSGTAQVDQNAIYQLALIFEELTGDKVCMSCGRYLAKVYKYFKKHAQKFN